MKRSITLMILLLSLAVTAGHAQEAQVDTAAYQGETEEAPSIVGGLQSLANNLVYPEKAREAGIEGMVFVEVFISERGSVDDVKVLRSASPVLGEAAVSAVRKTRFTPGKVAGEAVKSKVVVPVKFALH